MYVCLYMHISLSFEKHVYEPDDKKKPNIFVLVCVLKYISKRRLIIMHFFIKV